MVSIPMKNKAKICEISDDLFYCNGDLDLYAPNWFLNREIDCGDSTIRLFEKILGLKRDGLIVLKELTWKRDYFDIELWGRKSGIISVMIKKYRGVEEKRYNLFPYHKKSGHFIIIHKGRCMPSIASILSNTSNNLRKINPADIFKILFNDKKNSIKVMGELHNIMGCPFSTEYPLFEWGNKHIKCTFMFLPMMKKENARGARMSFPNTFNISHGDCECVNMDDGSRNAYMDVPPYRVKTVNIRGRYHDADSILYDNDIVCGGLDKLKNILDSVSKKYSHIIIQNTCTPIVIGDDVKSLVAYMNRKNPPFYFIETDEMMYIKHIKYLFSKLGKVKKATNTINFIGFLNDKSFRELLFVLKKIGIKTNLMFVPELDQERIKGFFRANLQVFFPTDDYDLIYENVFKTLDMKYIIPNAPYGIRYTTAWLESVAQFFSIDIKNNVFWKKYYKRIASEWNRLKIKANKFRLGIIVSCSDVGALINPKKFPVSIPLLQLLDEMGFGLDILIYDPSRMKKRYKKSILKILTNVDKHKVDFCSNYEQIREWLASSRSDCIYSDFVYDKRLCLNGKTRFPLSVFEKGYEGAIRSLKRLLNRCELNFYKDYHYYSKETAKPISVRGASYYEK